MNWAYEVKTCPKESKNLQPCFQTQAHRSRDTSPVSSEPKREFISTFSTQECCDCLAPRQEQEGAEENMRLLEAKERVIPDSPSKTISTSSPCVILILQMHKSNPETSGICKLNDVVFSKINTKTLWDPEIHLTLNSQLRIYSIRRCF